MKKKELVMNLDTDSDSAITMNGDIYKVLKTKFCFEFIKNIKNK
jgi:hypothetical protein